MIPAGLGYPLAPSGGVRLPPAPRRFSDLTLDEELAHVRALTPRQRVSAMYRGELTIVQLCKWAACAPGEVALLNNEFIFIAAFLPEVADAHERTPRPAAESSP